MEQKINLEIKEVYGIDALRYLQMCCSAFHRPNPDLDQPNLAELLQKKDEEARAYKVGESKAEYRRFCAYKDGQIIAGMETVPYLSYFDGNPCGMSEIGEVISDPETRRSGAIRAIFLRIFQDMREQKQWLSFLHPFISEFYRKFGYEVATDYTVWEIPAEYLPKADNTGIKRYIGSAEQKADIQTVMNACRSRYNMALCYTDRQWEKFFKDIEPYTASQYCYLHYDAAGAPDGVLIYHMEEQPGDDPQKMNASHGVYFRDPAGLKSLLAYAATLSNYFKTLRLELSAQADITRILPEMVGGWGKKKAKRTTWQNGLSRVVDVAEILKLAKYRGTGKVTLKITDICCEWNDHTFTVEFSADSVQVTVTDDASPDMEMDINAFTSLILGRYSVDNWDYLPNVTLHGNEDDLRKVFYRKPLWMD